MGALTTLSRAILGFGGRDLRDERLVRAVYAFRATFYLLAWGTTSGLIILLNDAVLNKYDFPYPIAVSATGPLVSWIIAAVLVVTNRVKLEKTLTIREWLLTVFPIGFFTAVTYAAGNQLYLYLSVSFIQMMKSLSPCVVFAMLVMAKLDTPTKPKVVSVAMMTVGMGVACATEETFTALGMTLMIIGEGAESMRMVLFQNFLDNRGFGLLEGLFYTCPANLFFLAIGVAIFEEREISLRGDLEIVRQNPWPFIAVSVLGFLVLITTLGVIKTCGSLTFKAAGQLRNIAIILIGVIFMGEKTTFLQLFGYGVNVLGFAYYQMTKADEDVRKLAEAEGGTGDESEQKLLDSPRSSVSNGSDGATEFHKL
ncbi:Triose-phosphate transporter domain [Ostreococcus tauri]|uniref:Triose-phosphate transporter domain n=1 Tax=Ostreococcus tauri TaxID=70448 RepID=A0A090M9H3_OSTTA|nr:Triose-phosphate transporter domain [Ostreococcus tauri]CEF98799.1 Triose-phosphate transporter domain [Ostreococcus tauri]|eukprot:XP_022839472.1 Triose-phosphate transporter domain [Ostreococcus tauri]